VGIFEGHSLIDATFSRHMTLKTNWDKFEELYTRVYRILIEGDRGIKCVFWYTKFYFLFVYPSHPTTLAI
jgi:hypothetical protein